MTWGACSASGPTPQRRGSTARWLAFESIFRRCTKMNENEFRKRLTDALGEPPPLAAPVLSRPDAHAPHAYPRTVALLAAGLAILLVLVLVASRIAVHPTGTTLPAAP